MLPLFAASPSTGPSGPIPRSSTNWIRPFLVAVTSLLAGGALALIVTSLAWQWQILGRAYECSDSLGGLTTFETDMSGHRNAGDRLMNGWTWERIEKTGRFYRGAFFLLWAAGACSLSVAFRKATCWLESRLICSTVGTVASPKTPKEDWFVWAESFLADWKDREREWAESFTADAGRVLAGAAQAARSLNQDYVGAEHLLAGILKFGTGAVGAALKDAGLSLAVLKMEIESARGAVTATKARGTVSYTPRCKDIIARARLRARTRGAQTDLADLLQELLDEKEGLPANIFRKRGIDAHKIRSAIAARSAIRE